MSCSLATSTVHVYDAYNYIQYICNCIHVLSVGNHCTFLPLYLLLHRMVPHLCPAVTKVGCLKHLAQQQICHQHFTPSSTPTTTGRVEPASIGDILDRIMNIVVVTTNQHQMVRCVNFVGVEL